MGRRSAPRAAARVRMTGPADTVFFGCYSVLIGFVAASVGLPIVAGLLGALLRALGLNPGLGLALTTTVGFLVTFVGVTAWMVRRTLLRGVEIGADGIMVWVGFRRWFIGYREIRGYRVREAGESVTGGEHLELDVEGGPPVRLRIDTLGQARKVALLNRLEEERRGYALAAAEAEALGALDRQGRSVPAWAEEAGRLLGAGGHYRQAGVAPEDVVGTLENAAAGVERRIGAALALASSGEPEAKARIRIVARASADAKLRSALESIAEGEVDAAAVEEALAAEAAAREQGQAAAEGGGQQRS